MTLIMVILSIIAGALLSIQAAVNSQLGSVVGTFRSAFLTFSIGALITAMLIYLFEPKHAVTLLDVPKWQLIGALFGVPYVAIMAFSVQRIGAAVATVAVITGQVAMSIMVDTFGWFHNPVIEFSFTRVLAVICLIFALYFIYSSDSVKNTAVN